MKRCLICEKIASWRKDDNYFFIHEFPNSIFVLGDHQYFKGYSLLLLKEHVRELHELPAEIQRGLFEELMIAGNAIFETFKPWKMNYSCYGNQAEHVHWHIFPRYETEKDHKMPPWLHSSEFANHSTKRQVAEELIPKIRKYV